MRWILRLALVAAAGAIGAATVARADDSASVHGKATAPGLTKERVDASPDKAEDNGNESDQPAAGESPDQAPPAPSEEPQLGQKLGVTPSEGTVRVRQPDEGWAELDAGTAVPNGTVIDARHGAITLSAAVDAAGTQQSATFSGAVFTVDQPNAAHSVTSLALHGGDFSKCAPAARRVRPWAAIAASRKPVRRLFGSGHGRFRTRGRFAAATVHGTIWVTEDYCDRTVITVKRGVVAVQDLHSGRAVEVHAGHSRTIRRR